MLAGTVSNVCVQVGTAIRMRVHAAAQSRPPSLGTALFPRGHAQLRLSRLPAPPQTPQEQHARAPVQSRSTSRFACCCIRATSRTQTKQVHRKHCKTSATEHLWHVGRKSLVTPTLHLHLHLHLHKADRRVDLHVAVIKQHSGADSVLVVVVVIVAAAAAVVPPPDTLSQHHA